MGFLLARKKYIMLIIISAGVWIMGGCKMKNTIEENLPNDKTSQEIRTEISMKQVDGYKQISMEEAVLLMEEENDYIILDVRTPEEYAEKHIPGAINVPNEMIDENEIKELRDKEQMILVYCRSGNRSKQASKKLAALGYNNVIEFGGINEWTGDVVRE